MKILEITEFSAGHCGVWTRVLSESKELVKLGHEVFVFSSNIERGTNKRVCSDETISNLNIHRFKSTGVFLGMPSFATKIFSKNPTYFNFKEELIRLNPNIVITHLLHHHSLKALTICKKLSIPCILVTHAPFNVKRRFPLNLATWFFDSISAVNPIISGNNALKQFDKIVAITHWEIPYLIKRGVDKNKIYYIPNGIPEEFFNQKQIKKIGGVLFLGRIAPVKNLETLISAAKLLPKVNFSIVGPAEEEYLKKIKNLIKDVNNIKLYPAVNDLKKKIKLIDEHKIFVLSSKREAMPQVLLEAMSRGRIVISSKTDGGKEIIKDGKTGFLFEIDDYKELANLIEKNIKGNEKVQNNAKINAKKYKWSILIKEYLKIFKNGNGLG